MNFQYRSYPNRTLFGYGQLDRLPELVADYQKVLLIATPRWRDRVERLQAERPAGSVVHFDRVIQHVPETLVREAAEVRAQEQPDVVVAIGGGSAVGLAKALALAEYLPQIAVPTTYSGSEQTDIFGISSEGSKRTGRHNNVLPGTVIYDPELTLALPKPLAATSAMNAMAHLMEAIYSPDGNPVSRHNALLGTRAVRAGLAALATADALTRESNEQLLFGAFLAGKCLCEVSMALHHKSAHVLGGSFGMEHSAVHTVLQAYVLAYQWPHLPADIQNDFRSALGDHPARTLRDLARNAGAKTDLRSIGFQEEDIPAAAAEIAAKPYANVAPTTAAGLEQLLSNAYHGVIE